MNEVLNFVFCVNDIYCDFIQVPILSLCENHMGGNIVIHIFTNDISQRNQKKLLNVVKPYVGAQLIIHMVDDRKLKGLNEKWSIYAWYRILAPALLPDVKRCLYLDADTTICNNVSELFAEHMDNIAVAGVIDVENFNHATQQRCSLTSGDTYICSGVLMMNLEYWRKHDLTNKVIAWAKENNSLIKFPDQDTINILCKDIKTVLPIKYGVQNVFFKNENFYHGQLKQQLAEAWERPGIIHFAGCAPWITEFSDNPFHAYWTKYNNMLPHKVKMRYLTKGINGLKVRVARLLHPYNVKQNRLEIESKLR